MIVISSCRYDHYSTMKNNYFKELNHRNITNGETNYYGIGSKVPNFTLKDDKGTKYKIMDFYGKWLILYFWSTKSPVSVRGLSVISDAQQLYGDTLHTVCLQCYNDKSTSLKTMDLNVHGNIMHMVKCDEESRMFRYFRIQGFPTRVLINPQGKIIDISEGGSVDGFPYDNKRYLKRLQIKIR